MLPESLAARGDAPADVGSVRTFATVGTTVLFALSTASLVFRCVARYRIKQFGAAEDYLVLAGYLISLISVVSIYICTYLYNVLPESKANRFQSTGKRSRVS